MGSFFDRVSDLGGDGAPAGVDPDALVGAAGIDAYVTEEATLQAVIVGDGALTRETDDWESAEEPAENRGAMIVVTDRQVHALVGDCLDPDVSGDYAKSIPLERVESVAHEDGLLSSSFVVTDDQGVRFAVDPVTEDGLVDVVQFVRQASERWETVAPVLDDIDEAAERVESGFASGDEATAKRARSQASQRLSEAGQTSFRHSSEIPLLEQRIEEARAAIEGARVWGYCRRARSILEEADDPDLETYVSAAEAVETSTETLDAAGDVTATAGDGTEVTPESVVRRIDDGLADRLDALDFDADPESYVDRLDVIHGAYATLGRAVGRLDADLEAVVDHHRESARRLAAAHDELADRTEGTGDERYDSGDGDTDAAREAYEQAIDHAETVRALARSHDLPDVEEPPQERLDRLETKVGETEWEWVGG